MAKKYDSNCVNINKKDHLANVIEVHARYHCADLTHLNKWSIILRRMMVVNDGVIASFVVTANMHPSTHVTTSLILI